MLDREYTVYFDTQFYVQLCRADEAEAGQIIRDLNSLNVRHVISNVLIRELLTSRNRTDLDEILVQRVRQFNLSPYCADTDLAWEVLLLPGQDRVEAANTFRELDDQMTAVANAEGGELLIGVEDGAISGIPHIEADINKMLAAPKTHVQVLQFERGLIRDALTKVNGKVTYAAELLGVGRQWLAYISETRHPDLLNERTPVRRRRSQPRKKRQGRQKMNFWRVLALARSGKHARPN